MLAYEKLKVGLVGTYRRFFDKSLMGGVWRDSIATLKALTSEENCEFCHFEEPVATSEDAMRATRWVEDERVDFLLVQSTSFASGDLFYPLARSNVRLGLWAIPEPISGGGPPPLNSFCGMNMNASIIKNYLKDKSKKFKWFFGHPQDEEFSDRLALSVRVLSAIKRLSKSRLALLGGVAPGYYDLCFDERMLQKIYGVTILRHEVNELIDRAVQYSGKDVTETVKEMQQEGKNVDVNSEGFERTARMYLTLRHLAEENSYCALAVSCWPKIREEYNLSVCSALGRLNQNNIVAACEGDLSGALSMLILNYLNGDVSVMTDLVSFDPGDNSLLMWHCGPAAQCWADINGICFRTHFGAKSGIINDMTFASGPTTILRVTGEGDRLFCMTADISLEKKESYVGSRGWFQNPKFGGQNVAVLDLIETIIVNGVEHHYAIGRNKLDDEVTELAYWLDLVRVPLIQHRRYAQGSYM